MTDKAVRKCASCGKDIRFVEMESGQHMPCNHPPIVLIYVPEGGKGKTLTFYKSHFADCPNADRHRKKV